MEYLSNNQVGMRFWKAKWIWFNCSGIEKNTYYYFRREFNISKKKSTFKLYITAESKYKVYINGEFIGCGPPMSHVYYKYYDIYDISKHMKDGLNCISVIVNYVGNIQETRGGLLAEIVENCAYVAAYTDNSWSVIKAGAWNENTFNFVTSKYNPFQEFFDARKIPHGWDICGYNDSFWEKALVLNKNDLNSEKGLIPWRSLVARDIPHLEEKSLLPSTVTTVEECLEIKNRVRSEDISIGLSMTGNPIKYTKIKNVDNLLIEDGCCEVSSSEIQLAYENNGVYNPCIVLDFSRVITAFAELVIEGSAGGIIDIGYAETLIDGYFNNAIEGQFADRYTMAAGKQVFRTFTWKAFRYIKLIFRNCTQLTKVHSIKAITTAYPFIGRGVFNSGDMRLNRVFDICKSTISLCSNESIMDTPWREQAQWLGDVAAVTLGGVYACFGDTILADKFFRQTGESQLPTGLISNITNLYDGGSIVNTLADYSLWWVIALWNHYMYTGNEFWIHRYYPHVIKIIQVFTRHKDGNGMIRDFPFKIFIDWAGVDRSGACAVLNAMFYGAVEIAEKMADLKKDSYFVELFRNIREVIKKNFIQQFYCHKHECFADGNKDGVLSENISEHTNAAAIYWNLCDEAITRKIVQKFYVDKEISYTEAQPFFTMVVLQALDKAGRFDLALSIIEDRWGKRMVDKGATSVYEEWTPHGTMRTGQYVGVLRSISHAWSAHPAEFLIRNLIGLEIMAPGCSKIRIRLREAPFDFEVGYPIPQGVVTVKKNGNRTDVLLPAGVKEVT